MFVIIILYEMLFIPLLLLDPPKTSFSTIMQWFSRLFWTFNIPRSFVTGFVANNGHVVVNPTRVLRRYLFSWFFFDVFIVVADWAEAAMEGGAGKDHAATNRRRWRTPRKVLAHSHATC